MWRKMTFLVVVGALCRVHSRPTRTDPLYGASAASSAPDGPTRALLAARAQDGGVPYHPLRVPRARAGRRPRRRRHGRRGRPRHADARAAAIAWRRPRVVVCERLLPPQGGAARLPARHARRAARRQARAHWAQLWRRRRLVERAAGARSRGLSCVHVHGPTGVCRARAYIFAPRLSARRVYFYCPHMRRSTRRSPHAHARRIARGRSRPRRSVHVRDRHRLTHRSPAGRR